MCFLRDLGHTGVINSLNDVMVDQMHQPWRTFVALINRSLSGKTSGHDKLRLSRAQIIWSMYFQKNVDYVELLWEDFTYHIDNKEFKKQEKMYYPRFTKITPTVTSEGTGDKPRVLDVTNDDSSEKQDEESDDDDQEEEFDQDNKSEDDEMKSDEEQGMDDTTDHFDDDADARLVGSPLK
ncbi:hypothetical protein Tco_1474104 [Tanacetum coccineum]